MSAVLKTQIANEWTGGFVANLSLSNDASAINNWTIEFDSVISIVNIWNAEVVSHVGNHYVLQGLYYDASLAPNEVVNIGFQAANGQSSSLSNLSISAGTVDTTPRLTVWDMDIGEGGAGSAETSFTIDLSTASATPVTVTYATRDGTATDGVDYIGAHGSVTFAPGETHKTVAVSILADNLVEGNETFSLDLTSPSGALLRKGTGTVTIHDATPPPTFSVSNAYANEPASGSVNAAFTITMSKAAAVPITIAYATQDGTAHAGSDYTATSGTVTFAAGETSKVVNVAVNSDAVAEAPEAFALRITNPTLGNVVRDIGTGTIVDPAGPVPSLSVADIALAEPASGSANASFTVSLSAASLTPVTVAYATQDGTAKSGSDYTATSGTLTFAPGETSKVVNVAVAADARVEGPESFQLALSSPTNAGIAHGTATATVADGTAPPSFSISDASVTEPASGSTLATFTITLSKAAEIPVSVAYATQDGTAHAGQEYTATAGTLTFAAGETSKTVSVAVLQDMLANGTSGFALNLSNASLGSIADSQGAGTILDSGITPPSISASDARVTEPASGSANASFLITLDKPATGPVTVHYATGNGTALAGSDYTAASGTVSFATGETTKTVDVAVNADALVEGTEAFQLTLSAASGGTIGRGTAAGTIYDGTPAPTLSVGNISLSEPTSGTATASFTVTMSKAAAVPVTVAYATQDGTALAGSDYTATSGTLTFAAGETSKTVNVTVNADALAEGTESFALKLAAPTIATILNGTGTATLLDAMPSLSVGDINVAEPVAGTASAVFTVSLNQASAQTVTVNYATSNGTALAGSDYTAASGILTFAPGETSKTVAVSVNADAVVEGNELFALNLSGATNALYARPAGTATIADGTRVASFSVSDAAVTEPASGTANASFTVTLAQALGTAVTVDYDTQDGTALHGADFLPGHGTLTFAAGETSKTVTVAVKADNLVEGTEAFALKLSNASAGSIARDTGTGTILDAAAAPSFSVNDVTVTEPTSGTATANFTVTLAQAAAVPLSVAYTTVDGTALAGSDYTATSGTLTFAAGETSKTVTVAVKADALVEATEAFSLQLSAPSLGTLARATGTGTVQDLLPALAVGDASVAEPSSGTATENFTVTLSKPSATAVTVHYATQDGTALAGTDYTATSGTLTFAPGETSKVVAVAVTPNAAISGNEQFSLVLSTPTAATLADDTGVGSILYTAPGSALKLTETVRDQWGQGFVADFGITNSGPAQNNWTVSFDFDSDLVNIWNARVVSHVGSHYVLAGLDYDANLPGNGAVDFGFQANGQAGGISHLVVSAGGITSGGTVGSGTGGGGTGGSTGGGTGGSTGDSGAAPTLSVHNLVVAEPAGGTGTAHFSVTLSHAYASAITVDYATQDDTATAGSDYTATHGSLTFAAGETSHQVDVTILPDAISDPRESFNLLLSNASGASITDPTGVGTILEALQSQENPGWLHTDGNQIVNDAGVPVQLNSVSWFGFESANFSAHGLWTRDYHSMMDQMVQLGFNSIRIPYADQMFDAASKASGIDYAKNPDLVGLSPLEILDHIVDYADKIGLKIVLDHHRNSAGAGSTENGLWYDAKYSEAAMIKNWEMLADRYGDNPSVVGADLHNEPHAAATWGDGSLTTDWQAAAERIGDAVLSHAPNWLIFVEGIGAYNGSTYWWGGDLEGAKDHPVELSVDNRLVYSPHDYPNSIYPQTWFSDPNYPANEPTIFSQKWGYLYEQDIAPLWIGEWGTKLTDPKDVQWAQAITSYLHGDTSQLKVADGEMGPSWSWWAWNPNSGDTGGILKDDWLSVNLNKIELLQPLMYGLIPTEGGSVATLSANAALGLTDQSFTGGNSNDVLFRNDNGATWFWEVKDGAIAHQGAVAFLDPHWTIVGSGDTDGSGKAEILVRTPDGFFGMWQLDANLQGHYMGSPGWLDSSWSALQMKDFNGDGLSEVLFRHETDNSYWAWQLNGSTVTSFTNLGTGPVGASYAGAGDFNGDAKADVLWRAGNGTLAISFSDGQGFATTKDIIPQAPGWTVKGVADFNGDGKTDLLLTNDLGTSQIWEMAGNIVTKVDDLGHVDPAWQVASVGDLNGDAKADILWLNTSGELWAWNMDGGQIASQGSMGWVTADWHVVGA